MLLPFEGSFGLGQGSSRKGEQTLSTLHPGSRHLPTLGLKSVMARHGKTQKLNHETLEFRV